MLRRTWPVMVSPRKTNVLFRDRRQACKHVRRLNRIREIPSHRDDYVGSQNSRVRGRQRSRQRTTRSTSRIAVAAASNGLPMIGV